MSRKPSNSIAFLRSFFLTCPISGKRQTIYNVESEGPEVYIYTWGKDDYGNKVQWKHTVTTAEI